MIALVHCKMLMFVLDRAVSCVLVNCKIPHFVSKPLLKFFCTKQLFYHHECNIKNQNETNLLHPVGKLHYIFKLHFSYLKCNYLQCSFILPTDDKCITLCCMYPFLYLLCIVTTQE